MLPSLALQLATPLRRLFPGRSMAIYEQLIGPSLLDLLFYWPVKLDDRRIPAVLTPDLNKRTVTCQVHILGYKNDFSRLIRPKMPLLIQARFLPAWAKDPTQEMLQEPGFLFSPNPEEVRPNLSLVFFRGNTASLKRLFPSGKTVMVRGLLAVSNKQNAYSIVHPTLCKDEEATAGSEVIYSVGTRGKQDIVRILTEKALKLAPKLDEWLPDAVLQAHGWPGWNEALEQVHHPQSAEDLTLHNPARQRLILDELLAKHLMVEKGRVQNATLAPGCPNTQEVDAWCTNLPFALTDSQRQAIRAIQKDLASTKPMLRLLQGDVGSGKTVVALAAALQVLQAGYQVAFLAPTDVLAQQHFKLAQASLGAFKTVLYTGSLSAKTRAKQLEEARLGSIRLLVGTHALIQDQVAFENLGLAIIDEQHRFGVDQRLAFFHKSQKDGGGQQGLHTLFLSATPIPRTLLLSQNGDVAVSVLSERPAHQQKVESRVMSVKHVQQVFDRLPQILNQHQQVYWVCPLIKPSEALEVTPVEKRFESLQKRFPGQVALLHGQMKPDEKQRVMADFYAGKVSILVSTTVIEIGVDAPNATVMVIEHAERFGLAQLHQLRGRVGRGSQASYCLFLYGENLTDVAQERLKIVRNFSDGFKIAEMDLSLRGSGNLFGTQQSGQTNLRLLPRLSDSASSSEREIYHQLVILASTLAKQLISRLEDPSIQTLLYLFQKDLHDENIQLAG